MSPESSPGRPWPAPKAEGVDGDDVLGLDGHGAATRRIVLQDKHGCPLVAGQPAYVHVGGSRRVCVGDRDIGKGACVEVCYVPKAMTPSMRGGFSWRAPCVAMAPDCSSCCCLAFRSVAAAIALCGARGARDESPTLSANDPSQEAIAGCVLVTECHNGQPPPLCSRAVYQFGSVSE